ncbi:MAG: prepilin-type N-terminal cleavage/methylation domain-containing protein [Phycisphaera sp.]|nr:prepilin-type N-terminal cleavage/methylation domain-containing protein [Phycisphaera sp.]
MSRTGFKTPLHQGRGSKRSRGITLIELMVTIAIIAVLMAILLPALSKTKELNRRALCLTNQRSTAQAAMEYAVAFNSALPPSQMVGKGWTSAYDLRVYQPASLRSNPMGIGLLINDNYLPTDKAGPLMHCPSLDDSLGPAPGHCMDRKTPWGIGASLWNDPAYKNWRVINSYNYRSPSYYRVSGQYEMKSYNHGATFLLLCDTPDKRFGIRYTHLDGYNRVFADGHGGWFSDPDLIIDGMAPYVCGIDGWSVTDEKIFTLMAQDVAAHY